MKKAPEYNKEMRERRDAEIKRRRGVTNNQSSLLCGEVKGQPCFNTLQQFLNKSVCKKTKPTNPSDLLMKSRMISTGFARGRRLLLEQNFGNSALPSSTNPILPNQQSLPNLPYHNSSPVNTKQSRRLGSSKSYMDYSRVNYYQPNEFPTDSKHKTLKKAFPTSQNQAPEIAHDNDKNSVHIISYCPINHVHSKVCLPSPPAAFHCNSPELSFFSNYRDNTRQSFSRSAVPRTRVSFITELPKVSKSVPSQLTISVSPPSPPMQSPEQQMDLDDHNLKRPSLIDVMMERVNHCEELQQLTDEMKCINANLEEILK